MIYTVEREIGNRVLKIETGRVAKQAHGSAWVQYGGTVVLGTIVVGAERENIDFVPLSVEYREKMSAGGRFPGGFFKREGRPTEKEVLTARLNDRPIRPLCPDGFINEIQVVLEVLSADNENDPDILSMVANFTAAALSPVPFKKMLASVRLGRIAEQFIVNPTYEQADKSDLNIVVAGTKDDVVMVEGYSNELPESLLLSALDFARQPIQQIIAMQEELCAKVGVKKIEHKSPQPDVELQKSIADEYRSKIDDTNRIAEKTLREEAIKAILEELYVKYAPVEDDPKRKEIYGIFYDLHRDLLRKMILQEKRRSDGRATHEIRPITCEIGLLPRTHGSALFTRGQTQSLATATLGTVSDEQVVDSLVEETTKRFMLHYNFPPYATGEVKPTRGPGRREIGHGMLAERALTPVIPDEESFPYTIRIVSDILESNGSSSMASVCGGSLALMDAGVPIKKPVAGVAMGLIMENNQHVILTDILGQEDHLGDMDFKVTGTRDGVTAFQMDVKIDGVSRNVMEESLEAAKKARLSILDKMSETISAPRDSLSPLAPRITIMRIPTEKIRLVIGSGGKTIRGIIDETGVKIDIDDDGKVIVASPDEEAKQRAIKIIEDIIADVEVGKIYKGKVTRLMNFGAFVEILPGKEGLVHISQLCNHRVESVEDVVKEGDEVWVKVTEIDDQDRVNLSRKAAYNEMGMEDNIKPTSHGSSEKRESSERHHQKKPFNDKRKRRDDDFYF